MREKDSDEFSMRDWSLVLLMMNEPSIVLLIFVELMMRERFAVLFGATIGPKSCKGPERLPPLVAFLEIKSPCALIAVTDSHHA